MGRVTTRVPRTRFDTAAGTATTRPDTVAVEEPLEIRVADEPVATTMRTPGDDFDLALGHLVTEGLLHDAAEAARMMHCTDLGPDGAPTFNVVDVTLASGAGLHERPRARSEAMTSACGVCGSATIDAIRTASRYAVGADPLRLTADLVVSLPEMLRGEQKAFERTGGLHAAGIAQVSGDGGAAELLAVREDVGRHNAVDKVVGAVLRGGAPLPLVGCVLVVSARASFEIVQKALMVGLPAVVAVSAPSSLAVELATEAGMTLVGFTRSPTCSAYSRPDRLR